MKEMTVKCLHCNTSTTITERSFSGGMARTLISLCRIYRASNQWVNSKETGLSKTDLAKLCAWNFAQFSPPHGRQKKPILFAPTKEGWDFAMGTSTTPAAALISPSSVAVGFMERKISIMDLIKDQNAFQSLWSG